MSTHIPADYFTKPILARLGVAGWILLPAPPPHPHGVAWQDATHGIDTGARTRAFCGSLDRTVGFVRLEAEALRFDRVVRLCSNAVGHTASRAEWTRWQTENEQICRPIVTLYLPRIPDDRGKGVCPTCGRITGGQDRFRAPEDVCRCLPILPDMGRIDCTKCLAAWDMFAAETGATVAVAETHGDTSAYSDEETFGAGAGDRGGRW